MNASNRTLASACAAAILLVGLAGCGERLSDTRAKTPKPVAASPSTVVVGQAPAEPSGDPPGTTPVASGTTTISKTVESEQKPQEGDNHSYSTTAPVTPQKAEGVNVNGSDDKKGAK